MYAPHYPIDRPKTSPPGWVDVLAPVLTQTLVVGGEASFVTRKLTPRLTRHGLYVAHHWPWKKQNGSFPENIGALFVLTDMCGHSMSGSAIAEAHKRGIPVIMATRKHAVNILKLTAAGFPEIPMLAPKPIVSKKHDPTPTPTLAPVPEPIPTPVPEEAPAMPTTIRRPRISPLLPLVPEITNPNTLAMMRLLAMSPGISNRKIGDSLPFLSKTDVTLNVQTARKALGIVTGLGKQLTVRVDSAVFNATCDRYNLDRVTIPPSGAYPKENLKLGRPMLPANAAKKAPTRSIVNGATAARVVATVATAEVPPEVLAATPANVQPPVVRAAVSTPDMKDLKDAVALLRAVMAQHNVESMTITATKADMRRVVVLDQSLDD